MRTGLHCCLVVAALAAVARSAVTSRLSPDSLTRLRRLSYGPESNLPAPAAAERQIETVIRKRTSDPLARNWDTFGKPLNPDDFNNAARLVLEPPAHERKKDYVDPTENVNGNEHLFEGDILGVMDDEGTSRNGTVLHEERWPRAEIPYVIASGFTTSERNMIALAVREFENNTCIRVVPLSPSVDSTHGHVHIVKGDGCYSSVGRKSEGTNSQLMSLGDGCISLGIILHEFMHAAGFWHEQSRPDRDEHVEIHWDNIDVNMRYNFHKKRWSQVQNLSEPYDLGSIMHYGPHAFALDRSKPTITALNSTTAEMGQRHGLSSIDIIKLNKLYECDGVRKPSPEVLPPACKDNNVLCGAWAQMGECTKNPPYMHTQCAHSCDTCPDSVCQDHDEHCAVWAQRGECEANAYMTLYCRQSCKLCNKPSPTLCEDNHKLCAAWARDGECDKNPGFMHGYCRKSCKIC